MGNKIFCISMISILMIGCDWGTIKDKNIEISDLLRIRKGKDNKDDRIKNQNKIELDEGNSVSKNNNISTADISTASLGGSRVDLITQHQVNEPMVSNDKAVSSQSKTEVYLTNNTDIAAINPKSTQNLEDSLSNTAISSDTNTKFLLIKNQKEELELSKKILPSKLENLESFLKTTHEEAAFEKAKVTQSLISDSGLSKEVVRFKEEYNKLYNLFWDIQQKFHSQKDLFIKDIKFRQNRENKEKNKIIFRSFLSIEKKIKDLNSKLSEIQSNFQIANDYWNNANSLLEESIKKLIWAIEKRHNNESRNQGQIGGIAMWWDKDQANTFAKDAKYNAEHSLSNLESAASYFQHSCSDEKEAKNLLEEIKKEFSRVGIL